MSAALGASASPSMLAELHHADYIIKVMFNSLTVQQKAKVGEELDAAGVSGEGMTRYHERRAVIEATTAAQGQPADAISIPDGQGMRQRMLDIESQATDVQAQAYHADILLQALFDKLDEMGDVAPGVAAINVFAICTARAVELMREAAANVVLLVAEGGAA